MAAKGRKEGPYLRNEDARIQNWEKPEMRPCLAESLSMKNKTGFPLKESAQEDKARRTGKISACPITC
jgi:hypothetical protein